MLYILHQLSSVLKIKPSGFTQNDHLTAFLLAMTSILLLFSFQSEMQEGDSLSFAYDISVGKGMAHPHHLLFSPIVWLIYKTVGLFFSDFTALAAAKLHNILWGSAGVTLTYYVGKKLFRYRYTAVLLSLSMLISLHYEIFSSLCEVYIPAMVCTIAVFYFCLTSEGIKSKKHSLFAAAFLSLAILYNQASILMVPALLLFYYFDNRKGILYILIAGVLILFLYIISYSWQENNISVTGFIKFVFAYLVNAEPEWGTASNFSTRGVLQLLHSQLSVIVKIEDATASNPVFAYGSLLIVAFCLHIIQCFKTQHFKKQRILLMTWILSYYFFILWWTPGYELLIPMIFPVLLLFTWLVTDVIRWILDGNPDTLSKNSFLTLIVIVTVYLLIRVWTINYPEFVRYHNSPDPAKLEADWDMKNIEPGYQIIQGYGPQIGLLYYHHYTETIEVDRFLSCFFFNEKMEDYLKLKPGKGRLIPIWYLNPYYEHGNISGMTHPKNWMKFFNYLFDYEKLNGDSIRMNQWTLNIPDSSQQSLLPLIRVYPERKAFSSYHSFMQQLDSTVIANKLDKVNVYTEMLSK